MPTTLAFDVYGTLIDTHGVTAALERHLGSRAPAFSHLWRDKQLEYSFRRGLMREYRSFRVCTRDALDFACARLGADIPAQERESLMATYLRLPAFPDVAESLPRLRAAGYRMFAFSNGLAEDVTRLLQGAGIEAHFDGVVSVDEVKSFKPDPEVYRHFLRRASARAAATWLVSGNPFDVLGALSAGLRAAWLRRSPEAVFDPWGTAPTVTVPGLGELVAALAAAGADSGT